MVLSACPGRCTWWANCRSCWQGNCGEQGKNFRAGGACMAEQADRGAERKRSKRGGFWATWRERLSFAATLITVSAVAIFLGWLMGQYAIQAVTGPAPSA